MSEEHTLRSDRVQIDESVMDIYRTLNRSMREEADVEQAPFETYKDIFMFAAVLGFSADREEVLPPGKKTTIRLEVFSEDDLALLKALAVAKTGGVDALVSIGEILTIAESYAHGGIHELRAFLLDQGGLPLWNLVDLVQSQT